MNAWLQRHCDANNSCFVPIERDFSSMALQWELKTGKLVSSVVVGDEVCLVVALVNDNILGISLNGDILWTMKARSKTGKSKSYVVAQPDIHNGRVYVPRKREFDCLDLATGTELWSFSAKDELTKPNLTIKNYLKASYPTADRDSFCGFLQEVTGSLFLSDAWGLVEVAAEDGRFIRNFYKEAKKVHMPSIGQLGGRIIFSDSESEVALYSLPSFSCLARFPYKLSSHPWNYLLSGSYLVLTQWSGLMCGDIATGKIAWKKEYDDEYDNNGRAATDGKHLFVLSDKYLRAYSLAKGDVIWQKSRNLEVDLFLRAPIAVTNQHLLYTCRKTNDLYPTIKVMDKASGEVLSEVKTTIRSGNGLSIIAGKAFVTTEDSVCCFA